MAIYSSKKCISLIIVEIEYVQRPSVGEEFVGISILKNIVSRMTICNMLQSGKYGMDDHQYDIWSLYRWIDNMITTGDTSWWWCIAWLYVLYLSLDCKVVFTVKPYIWWRKPWFPPEFPPRIQLNWPGGFCFVMVPPVINFLFMDFRKTSSGLGPGTPGQGTPQ